MANGASLTTAAAAAFELRAIILLQGIQFNNKDTNPKYQVPEGYLKKQLDTLGTPIVQAKSGVWTFRSDKQGVIYSLRVATSKPELKAALEGDKKVHVIYDGHSRYGRGCCFGTDPKPGEDWENGSGPNTGLFRMGAPYVAVPVSDIIHHGYTLDVVPASEKLKPGDCEHDLQNNLGNVAAHKLADIKGSFKLEDDSGVKVAHDYSEARGQLRIANAPVKPADKFWALNWPGEGLSVVTHAGWTSTASSPMDLGAAKIGCRVFCHFGCESFQHYHDIVRDKKGWKKDGDKTNFAYFTSAISYDVTTSFWLYRLFTYDQYNANKSWEPSLEYARVQASDDLKAWCKAQTPKISPYRIV